MKSTIFRKKVRAVGKYNCTSLHRAAEHNPSADVIRALVDAGAVVDARGKDQDTPLHIAAQYNPSADDKSVGESRSSC